MDACYTMNYVDLSMPVHHLDFLCLPFMFSSTHTNASGCLSASVAAVRFHYNDPLLLAFITTHTASHGNNVQMIRDENNSSKAESRRDLRPMIAPFPKYLCISSICTARCIPLWSTIGKFTFPKPLDFRQHFIRRKCTIPKHFQRSQREIIAFSLC